MLISFINTKTSHLCSKTLGGFHVSILIDFLLDAVLVGEGYFSLAQLEVSEVNSQFDTQTVHPEQKVTPALPGSLGPVSTLKHRR